MFEEHEQIVLTDRDTGDEGEELGSGEVGIVMHVHPDRGAYVVEFLTLDGATAAIDTVLPSQARPVANNDIIHARPVETPA